MQPSNHQTIATYAFLLLSILILLSICSYSYSQSVKIEIWYDDEKKLRKEEYHVLNHLSNILLDGLYTSYHQNQNIKSKGNYSNGFAIDLWKYYYESGRLKMQGEILKDKNQGVWKYYYENGKLSMQGTFDNGIREREWKFYYENGDLKKNGNFLNGKKHGHWDYYYEDGTLMAQALFVEGKGIYKEYYLSGQIKMEGLIVNGKSDSLWKYYYENGPIRAEGVEKEGLKHGYWKFYHSNGALASEGNYSEGIKKGAWKYYYDNGNLSAEGNHRNEQKDGDWKLFYNNGGFKASGTFREGTGQYNEYYESGKLKIEGFVKNGENDSIWKYYYETGALEGKCLYKESKGPYTGFYQNGNIKMEGFLQNGKRVGLWKLYLDEGGLAGYYKTYYYKEKRRGIASQEKNLGDGAKQSPDKGDSATNEGIASPPTYNPSPARNKHKWMNYFVARSNEYSTVILSTNPFAPAVSVIDKFRLASTLTGHIPFSFEYYIQGRLGYEIKFTLYRNPFLRNLKNLSENEIYKKGISIDLKQKFYNKPRHTFMRYSAWEFRFTSIDLNFNIMDSTNSEIPPPLTATINESRYELSLIFGERFMKDYTKPGFTMDVFLGIGLGYSIFNKNYTDDQYYDELFENFVGENSITIPIRAGFMAGYAF
ncbi:MAG: hypothetical protein FVQ77_06420 [Cytophagales bacterium]|nr:hypothetical protein [Cytophagales bacterium]